MKKFLFLSIAMFLFAFTAFGQTTVKAKAGNTKTQNSKSAANLKREKFDPTRNAKADLESATAKAQKQNKRIILDIGGEWCVWCIKMDNYLEANKNLKKIKDKNFIWVKINMSPENENTEFLSAYPQIKGYPHLYVLEKDGTLLQSQDTSELEEGKTYNLQKFTDFLKNWSPPKK